MFLSLSSSPGPSLASMGPRHAKSRSCSPKRPNPACQHRPHGHSRTPGSTQECPNGAESPSSAPSPLWRVRNPGWLLYVRGAHVVGLACFLADTRVGAGPSPLLSSSSSALLMTCAWHMLLKAPVCLTHWGLTAVPCYRWGSQGRKQSENLPQSLGGVRPSLQPGVLRSLSAGGPGEMTLTCLWDHAPEAQL